MDPSLEGLDPPNVAQRAGTAIISDRERDVLQRTAVGHGNREIAAALRISVKTVEVHKANAMRRLEWTSRADLRRYASLKGWLQDL